MDLYIKSFLSVLSNIQIDAHIIMRSPLFCTVILDEYVSILVFISIKEISEIYFL